MRKHAKFTYSPLEKAFEKRIKIIENQGEKDIKALGVHETLLIVSNALTKNRSW